MDIDVDGTPIGGNPSGWQRPPWARWATVGLALVLGGTIAWLVLPIGPLDEDDWYFFALGRWLWTNPGGITSLLTEYVNPREPYVRPVSTLWFALMYGVAGSHYVVWHAACLALHAASSVLVFQIGRRLLPEPSAREGALLCALLYAAHPLHAEALAWINAQEALLMVALGLGAVLAHLCDRPWRCAALGLLAMLTKEQGFGVIGAVVLVDLLRFGLRRPRIRALAPLFAVAAASLVLRFVVASGEPDNAQHAAFAAQFTDIGPLEALTVLLWEVPTLAASPVIEGLWPGGAVVRWLLLGTALALVLVVARTAGKRETLRWVGFGLAWLVGFVLPAVADVEPPIAPARPELLPEWNLRHYTLALAGPAITTGWLLSRLSGRWLGWALGRGLLVLWTAGLIWNLAPLEYAGARAARAEAALDAASFAPNVSVRLREPLDPIAALLIHRRVLDPRAATLPVLIGEPRCGCARLPVILDLEALPSARAVSNAIFATHIDVATDPGGACTCARWRADAAFVAWDGNAFR